MLLSSSILHLFSVWFRANKLALNEEVTLNKKLSSEINNKVNQIKTALKDNKEYSQKQVELKDLENKIEKLPEGEEKESMIKDLVNLSKDLAVIEMKAINSDVLMQTILTEKQKSDNRLSQYEIYDSYLTTNSKGEQIDLELQKLNRQIQSFQHQDTDIKLYNEYKAKINNMLAPFVNTPYYEKLKTIINEKVRTQRIVKVERERNLKRREREIQVRSFGGFNKRASSKHFY